MRTDAGELSPRTFETYYSTCQRLIATFGKDRLVVDLAADDFQRLRGLLNKTLGHAARAVEIVRTRMVFKYALDEGLIASPVRYGAAFRGPGKRVIQKARAEKGSMMLEAADIRALLVIADVPMKAMVLLGVNSGYGNMDLARLPIAALDLENGWATFPRPKTGTPRRCKLWPETLAAVKAAIAARPAPHDPADAGLVFLTAHGRRLVRQAKTGWTDTIGNLFDRLLRVLKLKREGLGFYSLRRTCETIGGDSRDQVATDYIMGHVTPGMGSVYCQRIEDDRLVAVSDHIRRWLFPTAPRRKAR
jgi:integrase